MQNLTSALGRTRWAITVYFLALIAMAVALTSCSSSSSSITSITVSPLSPAVLINGTVQLNVTGTKADGSTTTPSVTWTTGNSAIATVSSGGLVTGVGAGTTTVTATSGSVTGTTTVLVTTSQLQSILVSPASATVSVSGSGTSNSQQFTATGFFADGSNMNITTSVNWNSSNTTVAVIGANTGFATGFIVGSANITANAGSITSNSATLNVSQ